jgi:hypothetical protein
MKYMRDSSRKPRTHPNAGFAARLVGVICFLSGLVLILQMADHDTLADAASALNIESQQIRDQIASINEILAAQNEWQRQNPQIAAGLGLQEYKLVRQPVRHDAPAWFAFAGVALMTSGAILVWWGKHQRWPVFADLSTLQRELNGREITLFLRPFVVDDEPDPADDKLSINRRQGRTAEEAIAAALRRYGSIVAIGRPRESMPRIGAYRLYVRDDEWQEVVGQLAGQAQLIIMRTGMSGGVQRELDMIITRQLLPHTIFVLSPGEAASDNAFLTLLWSRLNLSGNWPLLRPQIAALVVCRGTPAWFYAPTYDVAMADATASIGISPARVKPLKRRGVELLFARATLSLSAVAVLATAVSIVTAFALKSEAVLSVTMPVGCGSFLGALLLYYAGGKDPDV